MSSRIQYKIYDSKSHVFCAFLVDMRYCLELQGRYRMQCHLRLCFVGSKHMNKTSDHYDTVIVAELIRFVA